METPPVLSENASASSGNKASATSITCKTPSITEKLSDNDHGNRFQSKLLFLFFIRAINKEYKFYLGTELFNFAGKFDDLIFVKNDTSDDRQPIKSYLYLQAKHRMHEKPKGKNISTADLLNHNKGDFSLIKYFHSYRDNVMKANGGPKPGDEVDCVICTNIDFDKNDNEKKGIQLVKQDQSELNDLPREMLTYKPTLIRQPQINKGKHRKPKETNHLGFVATYLRDWAQAPNDQPGEPNQSFKKYLYELLSNNPIISHFSAEATEQMKFHQDFIDGDEAKLTEDAKKLRKIISNVAKDDSWKNWKFPFCNKKTSTCYRLKPIRWLEMHYVANVLRDCANCADVPMKKLDKQDKTFRSYQTALINEEIIDIQEKKFHSHFINNVNLSAGARELRNIIDGMDGNWAKWTFIFNDVSTFHNPTDVSRHKGLDDSETEKEIEDFFNNKLVFAVNTPNEEELSQIVKDEAGVYLKLLDTDLQSSYMLSEMVNWFKQDKNVWLSAEDGKKILLDKIDEKMNLLRSTAVSINYRNKLKQMLNFNDTAVEQMADNLKWLMESPRKMERIQTKSPKLTAVKVIAALERLEDYKQHDSYLVVSFKSLLNEGEREQMKQLLHAAVSSHHLLVIVCDEINLVSNSHFFKSLETMIPDNKELKHRGKTKKGIVIGGNEGAISDECNFNDLNEEAIEKMLDKWVSFQDKKVQVRDLVPADSKPDDIFKFSSITELLQPNIEITIPSLHTDGSRFNKSLYIERRMQFPPIQLDELFWKNIASEIKKKTGHHGLPEESLQNQFKIHQNGSVEWQIENEKSQKKIWEALKTVAGEGNSVTSGESKKLFTEEDFIDITVNKDRQAVIIAGVAGTGKSSILSNYYEKIKKKDTSVWAIKINLVDLSEIISKFDFSHKTAKDFFVDLPVVVGESSFAQLLLKHRLEAGDRVALMLDGFDEISSQCQDKVIELVKAITKKSIQIYVTTRPHFVDKLQDQLFQFAYTLEPFTEENQLDYLVLFWTDKLHDEITADEERKKVITDSLREFAGMLVERLSKTLNYRENDFMGIPLQCKMLAENFESNLHEHVKKSLEDNPGNKIQLESLITNKNKFDLVSLYESFMETKRRLFREEKAKSSTHLNQYLSDSINGMIEQIYTKLTKLAIKTIVEDQKDVDLFWQKGYQSEIDIIKQERETIDYGIKFGLMYHTGEGSKVHFLHLTYAEYLVAKHLYQGFHLEDNKHNKLLENKSVRAFIFNKMVVHDKYDGVRVFLNEMMKEIVDREEWRNLVCQRKIPVRLQKFARDISSPVEQQLLEQNLPAWSYKALANAVPHQSANVFKFIFDCFDATLDKAYIRKYLVSAFENNFQFFNFFYDQSTQIFKRCLDYYNDADDTDVTNIMEKLLNGPNGRISYLSDSRHNREESRENIKLLIEFMGKHRRIWKQMQKQESDENKSRPTTLSVSFILNENKSTTLSVFILNDYYDGLFEQYLELLLWLYAENDNSLADIWNSAIKRCQHSTRRNELDERIVKILTIIKTHGETEVVLDAIARELPQWYPGAFEKFYLSSQLLEEDSSNVHFLLERYSGQMTRLHQAAFSGDTKRVTQLLETIRNNLSIDGDVEGKNAAKEVVNYMARDNYGFTPVYIAATCGHEEVCRVMLLFLKDILPPHQLQENLNDENGFLYKALWDAVKYLNSYKFQLVINCVVQSLGCDYLVDLLNAEIREKSYSSISMFSQSQLSWTGSMPFIIKTLTENDVQDGKEYGRLNKLIFHEANAVKALVNIDAQTLKKMLAINGCEVWTKQLLYTSVPNGFYVMSSFFEKLDSDKLTEMVNVITLTGDGKKRSYWAEWIDCLYSDQYEEKLVWCYHFVQQISKYLGDKHVKETLLHDDGKVITRAFLLCRDENFVNTVLTCLSNDENRSDFAKYVLDCAPQLIQELFLGLEQEFRLLDQSYRVDEKISINMSAPHLKWTNILNLFVRYADGKQLSNLVNVILEPHKLNGGYYISIWSNSLDYSNFFGISEQKVATLLKCVSERCGENTVKELVLHGDGRVISCAILHKNEKLVKITLAYLSEKNRSEVGKSVINKSLEMIEEIIVQQHNVPFPRWMNITQLMIDYADNHQLSELVRVVLTVYKTDNYGDLSVWSSTLRFFPDAEDLSDRLNKLLGCVSGKLDYDNVKKIIFHNGGIVIRQAAWQRNDILLQTFLVHLNVEDQKEVHRMAKLQDSSQMPVNASD